MAVHRRGQRQSRGCLQRGSVEVISRGRIPALQRVRRALLSSGAGNRFPGFAAAYPGRSEIPCAVLSAACVRARPAVAQPEGPGRPRLAGPADQCILGGVCLSLWRGGDATEVPLRHALGRLPQAVVDTALMFRRVDFSLVSQNMKSLPSHHIPLRLQLQLQFLLAFLV